MQQEYNEHYLQALGEIAQSGAEIYLLSGEELRARCQQNDDQSRFMAPEFRQAVRVLCRDSLALSAVAAEQLCKGGEPHSSVTMASGGKVETQI